MSNDYMLTITPTADFYNILEISSPQKSVSFRFKDRGPLTDTDSATEGDKRAYTDHHWQQICNVLYELAGRKDVQAMFEERGLSIERSAEGNSK